MEIFAKVKHYYKKFLYMFYWVLNTLLVMVLYKAAKFGTLSFTG